MAETSERETLHRQFRQAIGMTPWAYLRGLRLAAARRALSAHTDGPIHVDRIQRVGYTHLSRSALQGVPANALVSRRRKRGGARTQ